jgi:hypothetical protein
MGGGEGMKERGWGPGQLRRRGILWELRGRRRVRHQEADEKGRGNASGSRKGGENEA